MNRETRQAIGVVAGLALLILGGLWFFNSDSGNDEIALPETPQIEEAMMPPYQEQAEPEQDEMEHDVTRIVIKDSINDGSVDVGEVLTGKVIVDDQVVQQAEPSDSE
ncbi:hypothetical protein [Parendozoicomonas haliclonae]|uniref:Uncharacterized protein n=1 Tax=Parendozoicomonas haliclonae TaxID=1960125 RepID=A0A1X7AHD9_9GAMM|nr:hypothetical protein [Parendozoicomonas haliclonae]SMA42273.1 hypothetical protein EHSB41UT_01411 [Parendozoicomonas haliclonae]